MGYKRKKCTGLIRDGPTSFVFWSLEVWWGERLSHNAESPATPCGEFISTCFLIETTFAERDER